MQVRDSRAERQCYLLLNEPVELTLDLPLSFAFEGCLLKVSPD
jgi:hypothetical protein